MRLRTAPVSPSLASPRVVVVISKKSQSKNNDNKSNHNHKSAYQSPPRITSNVKQNLQFLRLWREFERQKSATPRPATSYRKKKVVKEEVPDDTEPYKDPTTNLYYTNQGLDTAVPVLLVDGYNVCGYWPKLKKHFTKGRLDIARQKLIDELISFSVIKVLRLKLYFEWYYMIIVFYRSMIALYRDKDFKINGAPLTFVLIAKIETCLFTSYGIAFSSYTEVKVVVVFDAMMSGLPTHKESFAGIDLIFSSDTCADAWIEKEVVALKLDGCPKVWVVTSDVCQQQAAHAAGAFVWSCKALVSEIKASQKEFEQILNEHRSTSVQGKLLQHNLDREIVDALKDLKKRLSENGSM